MRDLYLIVMNTYQLLADAVVVFHALFVGFVVFGQLFILMGIWRGWRMVRNFWFRLTHLAMIGFVALEAIFGVVCPLTSLENHLRQLACLQVHEGSFMGRLAHNILFYDAPQWIFSVLHCVFAVVVLLTFILAPPRCSFRKRIKSQSASHAAE